MQIPDDSGWLSTTRYIVDLSLVVLLQSQLIIRVVLLCCQISDPADKSKKLQA